MNHFSNKQLEALRIVRLSTAEKERMLNIIKAEMSITPLVATETSEAGVRNDAKKRYHMRRPHIMNLFTKKIMPIALLIALLMGGTVSYAAEGTLPGDTLYPVKIHVNEKMQSAITLSPSAQAELEIRLAEKRLREAEALEREGRLDASTKSELRGRFDEHSGRAKTEIESFSRDDSEGAERMRTDLKVKFSQHGDVLHILEIEFEDEDGDDRHESRSEDNDSNTASSTHSSANETSHTEDRVREQETERHESRNEESDDDRRGREDDDNDDDRGDDDEDWDDDVRVGVTTGVGISVPGVVTTPAPSPTPAVTPAPSASVKTFTLTQIATHNNATSCYTIVSGTVYDVTSYIPVHKGGSSAILGICGKDGTTFFSAQHAGQPKPETMLASFKIGTLVQ